LAATSKNYYKEHKEEIRKRNDAWIVANRERYRAARREHDRAYPQQRRAWSKTYRRKHRDLYAALERRRRARKLAAPGAHTAEQVKEQYLRQQKKCYYCRNHVAWGKHHVDHTFPLARPDARDSIDHLVITCKSCNQKKSSKYPWEFFEGGRLL